MRARWFNLYGTHPLERSSKTKGRREGSSYLGRILLAFNVVPNDRPQLTTSQANEVKQPEIGHYQLWVDIYELINVEVVSKGEQLHMVVSMGPYRSD